MARLACVDVPFFSLQVLLRLRPEWKEYPAAVVDRNEPTGKILSINEAARVKGVRPGISYSQGLSLAGELRASTVAPSLIEAARREIVEVLYGFTPEVEPCLVGEGTGSGSFWLNAAGLQMLYPSLSLWANEAIRSLAERGFSAVIAVGFTRFGSYIIARARRRAIVVSSERKEEELVRMAPLRVLPLSAEPLRLLHRLGIETVGAFLDLPEGGVRKRFGQEAHEIFRWAQRERLPIQPVVVSEEPRVVRRLDNPLTNLVVLSAHVDELLEELLRAVVVRQKLVASVVIELAEGEAARAREEITPATPTRKASVLKGLSRLRLAERSYEGAIDEIVVSAREIDPVHQEGDLFASARRQAVEAGKRALALIRARFGNDSVRHAVLHDAHLPEERYLWEETAEPLFPLLGSGGQGAAWAARVPISVGDTPPMGQTPKEPARRLRAVRRELKEPSPAGAALESLRLIAGPFVLTGKWWLAEDRREYYFARTRRGQLLWLYRDERSGAWTLQGLVD